jgi:ABC-type transport system involved in multi-copper enzyme maturation permease subunit
MIAARIPWRSPWARLIPLMLLVMAPAAGQWLGWMMAPETLEPDFLLPGLASWAVIGTVLVLLVKWSGLLTNPSLQMEIWAQMPGASLAFLAAAVNAMSAHKGERGDHTGFAALPHCLACLWICANAFGSEFDHRTMGQLLVQPRSRGRIYLEKLGVAGGIAGTAAVIFFLTPSGSGVTGDPQILLLILGLASAPFFTLISRSTLAGFVFTLAVPLALYLILQTLLDVYHARVYPDLADRSSEEKALLWAGGAIYLGATALAGWRVFKRLEWREGGAGGSSTPGLYALTGVWDGWLGRRWLGQHATAQLIRKELRLHVVPWLVAGILVGLWGLSLLIRKWAPESEWGVAAANPSTVTLFAGILGAFIFLVTGASAIAEERVLGTLEWQWTQPIPMARQWRIKLGVTTALALTLGLILPAALVWLGFDAEILSTTFGSLDWQPITAYSIALAALFATNLYASSVSQSSMKAVALTPLLLGSLWAVGALTVWGVVATFDGQSGNWWVLPDLDHVTDPEVLNQMPPRWLPTLGTLQQMSLIGAMILGAIWIGFVVQSARFNAQRLRMGWSTVSRQWGQLGGGLVATSLLGCLLYFGLSQKRAEFDYLSSFQMRREGFIQFATQAEQQGKFTPEYLSPLGITNRPSPKELVDDLIRQRGFRWLSQDFVKHFQRKPVVGSNPRFLMDPGLARRYGLQTRPTSPVSTTPSTNAASPESAAQVPQPMMMSRELMLRYGLAPQRQPENPSPTPSTNPASPESASTAPMPMMSQALMKRYGLMPRTTTNSATPTTPKASTNPPTNPAPGQ